MNEERRHPPTARRRAEALRSGRGPYSVLLTRMLVTAAAVAFLWGGADVLADRASQAMRDALVSAAATHHRHGTTIGAPAAGTIAAEPVGSLLRQAGWGVVLWAAVCWMGYVLIHGVQRRGRLVRGPRGGGPRGLLRCLGEIACVASYVTVAAAYAVMHFPGPDPQALVGWSLQTVAVGVLVANLFGIAAYLLAWWRFESSLWMTTSELREELRREAGSRRRAAVPWTDAADRVPSV